MMANISWLLWGYGILSGLYCVYSWWRDRESFSQQEKYRTVFSSGLLVWLILAVIYTNFELVLTLSVLSAGIGYAVYRLRRRRYSQPGNREVSSAKPLPISLDIAQSFFPVLLLVLMIRSFIAEPFRIPSGSMIPTLLVGDFIVVAKYSYGIRLPVLKTKVFEFGQPERGDVVVFRYPEDPKIDFIKRVIGLPGDNIIYRNNRLFINGEAVLTDQITEYDYLDIYDNENYAVKKTEHLPGAEHDILNHRGAQGIDTVQLNIPEGHYFVMGDNRDRSKDSRIWGLVPEKNLVGKAQFIWMHWGLDGLSRIGKKIH